MTAAPLKLCLIYYIRQTDKTFRGHMTAAPLKLAPLPCTPFLYRCFPRSHDRGPIEAKRLGVMRLDPPAFRGHMTAAPLMPSGSIPTIASIQTFRGHMTAAPLKPSGSIPTIASIQTFRGHMTAAPLKRIFINNIEPA